MRTVTIGRCVALVALVALAGCNPQKAKFVKTCAAAVGDSGKARKICGCSYDVAEHELPREAFNRVVAGVNERNMSVVQAMDELGVPGREALLEALEARCGV